jgi:hypothetical protein
VRLGSPNVESVALYPVWRVIGHIEVRYHIVELCHAKRFWVGGSGLGSVPNDVEVPQKQSWEVVETSNHSQFCDEFVFKGV